MFKCAMENINDHEQHNPEGGGRGGGEGGMPEFQPLYLFPFIVLSLLGRNLFHSLRASRDWQRLCYKNVGVSIINLETL